MEAKKTGRPRNVDFVCDQRKSVFSTKGRLNKGDGANIPRKEADVYVKLGLGFIQGGGFHETEAERPEGEGDGGEMV